MKIEFRFASPLRDPKDRQLLLIPETHGEVASLDAFFGNDASNFENRRILNVRLCTSDEWKPYLRIETPELGPKGY